MTYIREIHGTNFHWHHVRAVSANERMQMNYRFRCGLSRQWPPANYTPRN